MTGVYPCTIPDCDRVRHTNGLCQMHASRLKRTGTTDLRPPRPAPERICSIPGCDRPHKAKSYCKRHYMEIHKATRAGKPHAHQVPMPKNAYQAAGQALTDAQEIICDVRDIDPADVWHRISTWSPTRAVAAIITLAAMVPDDQSAAELLAWTDGPVVERTAPLLRSVS